MSQSIQPASSPASSTPQRAPLPPIRPKGPETEEQRFLREWFEGQVQNNMVQLEEGARHLSQLVTALFGLLFAVLAFGDSPDILQLFSVQLLGTLSILAYFLTLVTALEVLHPYTKRFQKDNLTEMREIYQQLLTHKANYLNIALWSFSVGSACFILLILAALWQW